MRLTPPLPHRPRPTKHHRLAPGLALLLLTLAPPANTNAQNNLPPFARFNTPSPAPTPPGDPFNLPSNITLANTPALPNTPACAEWTRTAGPDESILITGNDFSRFTQQALGQDTRFLIADGTTNSLPQPRIQRLETDKVILTLPKELPQWGFLLLWPANQLGYGTPIALNQTEAWWLGPNQTNPGATLSVYGRNLSYQNDTLRAFVYLKAKLPANAPGQWLPLSQVNPYRLTLNLPPTLAPGDYEVWTHNGHGGRYGWSGPLPLKVQAPSPWSSLRFDVKTYGAAGDGLQDDTPAIQKALTAARQNPASTVYFPPGTYLISDMLLLASNTRWLGEGRDQTILQCSPAFSPQAFCLLYAQQGVTHFEMANLTLATNHHYKGNFQGSPTTPIDLRGSQDLRLTNLRFAFQGDDILQLDRTQRVFITGCELIGKISFLGKSSQVFIDRCAFRLTNDAELALHSWGGTGISLTNSTCRDFDNADPTQGAGWGKGRFFVGTGNWGANRFTYIAHNTTTDLAPRPQAGVDQNSGEQLLWEGNGTDWVGSPGSSTAWTTTLPGFSGAYEFAHDAVIIKGRGLGQSRRITAYQGSTITLESPWTVLPDPTSVLVLGRFVDRVVLYHNALDGKGAAVTSPTHVASAGIEPFGGVMNLIAQGNTLHELRSGIATWATQLSAVGLEPSYFNLFIGNTLVGCRWGIQTVADVQRGEGTALLGTVYRQNVVRDALVAGLTTVAYPVAYPVVDGGLYEHNVVSGSGVGYATEKQFGGLYDYSAQGGSLANQLLYGNTFSRVGGGGGGSAIALTPRVALRENTYTNFSPVYVYNNSNPVLELPVRGVDMSGQGQGQLVESSLTLWNSGSSSFNWQASSSASWLTLSSISNNILDERSSNTIRLVANPKELAAGEYTAIVTITAGDQVKRATVKFIVYKPATIDIVSPVTNSTVVASTPISISVTLQNLQTTIVKTEFFAGTTKLGETLTSPFNFTWTNPTDGSYNLVAKITDSKSNVLTSNIVSITVKNPVNVTCTNLGSINWAYWANMAPSLGIPDIPVNTPPTAASLLNTFATPLNIGNYYGSQAKGYICPPVDGAYVFYIAGDDLAELYLSTDDKATNKKKIAYADWTCFRQYDKYASQVSAPIFLQAGRRYYIEALHIEGSGDDYVFVGWKLPNGTQQRPIPGSNLIPFQTTPVSTASTIEPPVDATLNQPATTSTKKTTEFPMANEYITVGGISVYPNPITNQLTIDVEPEGAPLSRLRLQDSQGKEIRQEMPLNRSHRMEWDVSDLSIGQYILHIETQDGRATNYKVIKQ